MLAVIVFVVILVVAIPVGFLMSTSLVAAILGSLLRTDAECRHGDSELIETNY